MGIPMISYHRAASLAEACELGRRFGPAAAFLAGGTELLPDYQRERETALVLIALETIEELQGIRVESGRLRIGALATIAEVARSPLVREWLPALAEAARAIGSPQIRSRATIGGNFCRAVACADTPPQLAPGRCGGGRPGGARGGANCRGSDRPGRRRAGAAPGHPGRGRPRGRAPPRPAVPPGRRG